MEARQARPRKKRIDAGGNGNCACKWIMDAIQYSIRLSRPVDRCPLPIGTRKWSSCPCPLPCLVSCFSARCPGLGPTGGGAPTWGSERRHWTERKPRQTEGRTQARQFFCEIGLPSSNATRGYIQIGRCLILYKVLGLYRSV